LFFGFLKFTTTQESTVHILQAALKHIRLLPCPTHTSGQQSSFPRRLANMHREQSTKLLG
jgi:hypothetical protein